MDPTLQGRVLEPYFTEAPSGKNTILVVDDEPQLRAVIRELLEECGYHVLEASDGASALRLVGVQTHLIDLLITDMRMPGMTGLELSRTLRESHPDLSVLLMSGYHDEILDEKDLLEGHVAFLPKPFRANRLLEIVRQSLPSR